MIKLQVTKLEDDIVKNINVLLRDIKENGNIEYLNTDGIEEICTYIYNLLSHIYNPKLLYYEIIRQYVSDFFREDVLDNIYPFKYSRRQNINILQRLFKIDKNSPAQKSEEWYLYRYDRITASDIASVFGKSVFTSRHELLANKCRPYNLTKQGLKSNRFMEHGNKYEICATWFYEFITNSKVNEFGCLPHPLYGFLGASPDGITDEGIMLEIKCPLSRPIAGIPPIYYWYQIQIQLEVANLPRCDYIECDFKARERDNFIALSCATMTRASCWYAQKRKKQAVQLLLKVGRELYELGAVAALNLIKARLAELRLLLGDDTFQEYCDE